VRIDWNAKTATLTAPADQVEKEMKKLTKSLATKGVKLTTVNRTSRERPLFDLKGSLNLAELLPGALKIAYLTAFSVLGEAFLDDPFNSEWQRAIKAKSMAELTISYLLLGAGRSERFFPFVVAESPWNTVLPMLAPTEHRVVVYNPGESGTFATVELFGGGFKIHCRLSRSLELGIPRACGKGDSL
jgi:hypothetical protein